MDDRILQEERYEKRHAALVHKLKKKEKGKRKKKLDLLVSLVSAIVLPVVIVSGIFGMNNPDL